MRISLVTRIYAPEPAAASFRLAALVRALARGGDDVLVLTTQVRKNAPDDARPPEDHVRIRRARVLRDRNGNVRGYLQYLSFDIPVFFRLLFSRRADVVVVEPPPTTGFSVRMACAIRRIPYVLYAPDVWTLGAESTNAPAFVIAVVRWLERTALAGAAAVIAVTDGVADTVSSLVPDANVHVVPNGIDTDIFTPEGERATDVPWGVYAGTTSEWQGADIFIKAMPKVLEAMPDASIAFVGQGSAWAALRELAAEVAPGAVRFVDPVPPAQAAVWLRSARAGLVSLKPGQGYDFALPTKVYASTACGTPVVFAGVGAGAELVENADIGWRATYDAESVARAMIAAFSDRDGSIGERVSEWTRANASQSARAAEAAAVVREAGWRERDE